MILSRNFPSQVSPPGLGIFFSPSKLNLFFRVLKKREDGFHEIASLFQAISLGDTLQIELSDKDSLTVEGGEIPLDSSNLIFKALVLFRKKTGLNFHASFHAHKRVPIQAGLGGGSGNAATTLWGLNTLLGNPASLADLIDWSKELGSDVTFFLSEGTAYCTGRGEIIQNLPPLCNDSLWIAKPAYGLETPFVFKACVPSQFLNRDPLQSLKSFYEGAPEYYNDLEIPSFQLKPELALLKSALLGLGFSTVTMTGSGTSFFCLGSIDTPPQIEGVTFQHVKFIHRAPSSWYTDIQ